MGNKIIKNKQGLACDIWVFLHAISSSLSSSVQLLYLFRKHCSLKSSITSGSFTFSAPPLTMIPGPRERKVIGFSLIIKYSEVSHCLVCGPLWVSVSSIVFNLIMLAFICLLILATLDISDGYFEDDLLCAASLYLLIVIYSFLNLP